MAGYQRLSDTVCVSESVNYLHNMERVQEQEEPVSPDLRIVLVGKTGSGKSASGNAILGSEVFKEKASAVSVTRQCQYQDFERKKKRILVIDTPGIFDTSMTEEQLKSEVVKCLDIHPLVPCVFLLVINLSRRFTEEEKKTVEWIEENFGEYASVFTIIVFTHEDHLKGKRVEDHIKESVELRRLVNRCGGRYHSLNNDDRRNRAQVTELLQKIDDLLVRNRNHYYSRELYLLAQTEMEERRKKENSNFLENFKKMAENPVQYFKDIIYTAIPNVGILAVAAGVLLLTGSAGFILFLAALAIGSIRFHRHRQ